MTARQRAKLKEQLLAQERELSGQGFEKVGLNSTSSEAAGQDEDGQPLNEMNQSIASGRNRTRAADLAAIREALARLRDDPDDFGLCEECDEPIPLPRLEAMPWAKFCVACQSRRDGPRSGPTRRKITDYR